MWYYWGYSKYDLLDYINDIFVGFCHFRPNLWGSLYWACKSFDKLSNLLECEMQIGNEIVNENCILHETYNQLFDDYEHNENVIDLEMKISDDSLFCHSFILEHVFLGSL